MAPGVTQQEVNTPSYLCQIVNSDLIKRNRVVQIGGRSMRQHLGPFESVIVVEGRERCNNCCRLKDTEDAPCGFHWVLDQKHTAERTFLGS